MRRKLIRRVGPSASEDEEMDLLAMSGAVATLLWIVAVVLVIVGIVAAVRGQVLYGVAMIIIGLLIGPGGVSIFH